MPVHVVLDGPPRRSLRAAVGQGGATAAGAILYFIALLAMWPWILLWFLLFYVVIEWVGGASQPQMPAWFPVPPYLVPVLLLVVTVGMGSLMVVGERMLNGQRNLVLYLRRFGYTSSTRTVSAAVARIGRRWRIATLDDRSIRPMGPRGSRALAVAGRVTGSLWAVAGGLGKAVVSIAILGGLGTIALVLTGRDDVLARFGVRNPINLLMSFATVIGVVLVVTVAGLVAVIVLAPFIGQGDTVISDIHEADASKALSVTDGKSLAVARGMMIARGRKIISARLFVLKVETAMWQRTVLAVAADSAVALIDVSEPTANIIWEIDQMQRRFGRRCVFIGHYDRLAHLFAIAEPGSVQAQMQERLDGCQVLAYRTSRAGTRHFTRALRAALEAQALQARRDGQGRPAGQGHPADG